MSADVLPITVFTLPYWAARTAFASLRRYRAVPQPLSARRLAATLRPNLNAAIFVIGSPRSGTTFLGDCLARIPEITYHFEPMATKAAARYVAEDRWSYARARWFYRSVYVWLMRIHLDGDRRFVEKTPRSSFVIPFLARAFPDARFVHILRDGRDVALSWSERPWLQAAQANSGRREAGGYKIGPYARFWVEPERVREFETTSDLHRCIWGWRRYTEAARSAGRALPAARYHEVRYETLVGAETASAQSTVTDGLLDFMGIEAAESRDRFRAAVAKGRPDSVGRWRAGCREAEVAVMNREAGAMLAALGYAEGDSTS